MEPCDKVKDRFVFALLDSLVDCLGVDAGFAGMEASAENGENFVNVNGTLVLITHINIDEPLRCSCQVLAEFHCCDLGLPAVALGNLAEIVLEFRKIQATCVRVVELDVLMYLDVGMNVEGWSSPPIDFAVVVARSLVRVVIIVVSGDTSSIVVIGLARVVVVVSPR